MKGNPKQIRMDGNSNTEEKKIARSADREPLRLCQSVGSVLLR
jgi:hypothetical protein